MAEQFISKFDGTTSDNLLDVINKNQGVFPFDTELNETSSKGLPNSVIAREINAIKDATSNNKGYFLTEEALVSTYPSANEGSKAYVGKNYPYKIYLYQNGLWTDSGQTGGDDSFNAGEFYTKTQIDQQHEAINNEISRVEKGANYEVLEYEVNIATTRLKVKENNRKGGYMITYNPGTGWIKEQYIGTAVTNEEWIKDENWKAEVLDENIQAIAENAQQQANLAANNAALAEEKANEAATQAAYAKEQGDRLSNIDLSLYRVVIDLPSIPEMSDDDMNKIYLKVSAKQGENNKYDEFVVVDGIWELLGQYEAAIDLTDYVGKTELSSEIAALPTLENISKFVCIDENGEAAGVMTKEQVAQVVGGLLKTQEFALSLSILSGYGCQFINLRKGIEQKLPDSVTGLVSIGYSPFNYNKVVKIKPVQQGTDIEELTWPWWGGSLSLRLDGEGYLYLKQTMWDSMIFRVTSL